ncbi:MULTISPECIES: hypothetical protein [unclassified Undibacterium]|uniref:hypothetical protein n=1 Tax=unclassified Undibacterium TaxID=2630295 RepID=UPI002AC9917E|nr:MULTISPECIES: hypothetical protein [unclassified Undibacterium]MEB0138910.1 hypothetical protein [Undibacterium sp. CCC2.1]MEB0171759.1 hypothetical protein [Undibacterium sp. CCC1.1]MEB0175541.1 hypothetical protein [Undibacterium sp. CCC3.4]MEB0214961.1 hypothetical protein [Undibacterium sp. 5I2]WPX44942.1 hypothetical protein RHM61_06890 [Undibacterium sp. CCC3.4]
MRVIFSAVFAVVLVAASTSGCAVYVPGPRLAGPVYVAPAWAYAYDRGYDHGYGGEHHHRHW